MVFGGSAAASRVPTATLATPAAVATTIPPGAPTFTLLRLRPRALEHLSCGFCLLECTWEASPHRGRGHHLRLAIDNFRLVAEAQQCNLLKSRRLLEGKMSKPQQAGHPKVCLVRVE